MNFNLESGERRALGGMAEVSAHLDRGLMRMALSRACMRRALIIIARRCVQDGGRDAMAEAQRAA